MRKFLSALFIDFLFVIFISAQADKEIILTIADNILQNTTYDFIDNQTGEVQSSVDNENFNENIAIRSPYNTWSYWNGVLNIAMLDLADYFQETRFKEFALRNYEFAFKYAPVFEEHYTADKNKWTYPFGQFIVTRELDDCGAMGGGLIEIYQLDKKTEYLNYIEKAADHILNHQDRLKDGTFVRGGPYKMTLWGDDLYMSIVFLARMGKLSGDKKYFDDAARQVINFTKYLYDPKTELYYHGWYSDLKENNVAHWGRCNGWIMLAQTDLLEFLPEDHPMRDTLISILQQQVIGVSRYQHASGLWHQLLDKTDSYLETSCSAMFVYSIVRAVNNGWLDNRYLSVAKRGWEGLKTKIQPDGRVQDICVGTGMSDDLVFYYNRPTKLNDIHGLGAVLMAGLEMLEVNQ